MGIDLQSAVKSAEFGKIYPIAGETRACLDWNIEKDLKIQTNSKFQNGNWPKKYNIENNLKTETCSKKSFPSILSTTSVGSGSSSSWSL